MTDTTTAATTAAATTTTTDTTTAAPADWTSGLNDGHKGYVQNKGFKSANDVLESYVNLEKLIGVPKERLVKLPETPDAPEWGEIYGRMGRPEKPEGYKFAVTEKLGDPEFSKTASAMFHKAGLTAKQAETVAAELNTYFDTKVTTGETDYKTKVESDLASLKKEWGAAFDQNVAAAKNAGVKLGIAPDKMQALESVLGFGGTVKFVHELGTKLGEANFVAGDGTGGPGFGISTPVAAKARINELMGDPEFTRRYLAGETPQRQEMERLHQQAYPQN